MGSFFSSIFTAPGTNARQGQQEQFNRAGAYSSSDLGPYNAWLQAQIPRVGAISNDAYANTTQNGRNALVSNYWHGALARAGQMAGNYRTQFSGNPALGAAAALGAGNDANSNSNLYAGEINSPQGMQAADQRYGSTLGMLNPAIAGLSELTNNVYRQPLQPVGQSPWSIAAPLLGQGLTGLFNSGGGDSSSGGSADSSGGYGTGSGLGSSMSGWGGYTDPGNLGMPGSSYGSNGAYYPPDPTYYGGG
jgi:hypothetical protein